MRTFVAIELDDELKRPLAALQARLEPHCPNLRWVDPAKIHLTLKFIGEIADDRMVDISSALDELAAECRPFQIAIEQVGVFGQEGPVKVVWVGVSDDEHGALPRCHELCERLLEPLGIPPERRPFRPHLTLARNREVRQSQAIRRAVEPHAKLRIGVQEVESVTFYQSTLTGRGPVYLPLSRHVFLPTEPRSVNVVETIP